MKYKITIPEPCHEDWSKMTPQEKGRFCDKCQKCVVDFTGLSTQQMFYHISTGGDLCGRFRPDQLNRDLVAAPIKKGFSFQWALTSALAFLGVNDGFGLSDELSLQKEIAPIQVFQTLEKTVEDKNLKTDSITIRGTITDAETGETIPFAHVVCPKIDSCYSDLDGNFILKLPTSQVNDSTNLVFSFIGYRSQKVFLAEINSDIKIKLQFSPENILPVEILGRIEVKKKR